MLLLIYALTACSSHDVETRHASPASSGDPATSASADVSMPTGALPVSFIPNRGQLDAAEVAYYTAGRAATLYFTPEGVTLALARPAAPPDDMETLWRRWVLKQRFVGANANTVPSAQEPTPTIVSYFQGAHAQWQADLPTYTRLEYTDLWPGIHLRYEGSADGLKYTFVVEPGADPAQIRLAYEGATGVRLTGAGQLALATPAGTVIDDRPYAFQEIDGRRVQVSVSYAPDEQATAPAYTYGFDVGQYDPRHQLLIDPALPLYGGFLGGAEHDAATAVTIDSSGNAYVTGYTFSPETSFPASAGPDRTFNGGADAFVAGVNAEDARLRFITYLGGESFDAGNGIALDPEGNIYVTGQTQSDETSFPVVRGPDVTFNGGVDAFVASISADGTRLRYAGYVGGADFDLGSDIAVDRDGNAYVVGQTNSTQATFPVTIGPDTSFNGGVDAFVASISADGRSLRYAGYIGGSENDAGTAIAVDAAGNAYITGSTASPQDSFPVKGGPGERFNGDVDAFVASVSADGTRLNSAGYLGGEDYDAGADIAVDSTGTVYITGQTQSSEESFPVTIGPDLSFNGNVDAFVAALSANGTEIAYAGYIGGEGTDAGTSIAVGSTGVAYIMGSTTTDETFPLVGGPDLTYNGKSDAFVAKVSADGSQFTYAGYIGGAGDDQGLGIAVDAVGNAYLAGFTNSTAATFPVSSGPDLMANGDNDAFIMAIATVPDLSITQEVTPARVTAGQTLTYTLTVQNPARSRSLATGVVLSDTLPPNISVIDVTTTQGHCRGTRTMRCTLGSLDNGEAAIVTLVATTTQPGQARNVVRLIADEPDPDPANNVSTHTTVVVVHTFLPLVAK